ncbi:hypothetical protein HN385_03215 [archaeon]|jgi:hypothetical protein|nr:hypothetical protein [archaeon]MBT3450801.1 hypothetical protein [archaeon]MBT6868490.1 hypothetical protein [archaeon]MBT7193589.1 hypothetical protein [archaeon]MBT7380290.1 hypothetical protein [archaeon]
MRCDMCGDRIKKKLCLKCWSYLQKINPTKNPEEIAEEYTPSSFPKKRKRK